MDKKILKMAADVMRELSLTEISIKDGETEIMMKREAVPAPAITVPAEPEAFEPDKFEPEEINIDSDYSDEGTVEVAAPLIGVFHKSASPTDNPFVQIGSMVKKGDVLCTIESMKMTNEITADCDGMITDICAADGSLVEYGQVLFRIARSN